MICNPKSMARIFTQRNIDKLPDDAFGIYGLWYNNICLYIGKAERQPIKNRLMDHFKNCHNPDLKNWIEAYSRDIVFMIKQVPDTPSIHRLERKFIARYAPRTNMTK